MRKLFAVCALPRRRGGRSGPTPQSVLDLDLPPLTLTLAFDLAEAEQRHNAEKPTPKGRLFREEMCGGVLLSREASLAVPSALRGLTSGFGMGPGVSPSLWPPQLYGNISLDGSRPYSGNRIVDAKLAWSDCKCVSSPRSVSTGQLSASRRLHFRPINPVVWLGTLPTRGGGRPYLEAGFPLRCFQRLSLPDVANQPCSWRNNWHTRGQSVPVLSY